MSIVTRFRRAALAPLAVALTLPCLAGCEGMANFMEEMAAQQEAARLADARRRRSAEAGPEARRAQARRPLAAGRPRGVHPERAALPLHRYQRARQRHRRPRGDRQPR